MRQNFFPIVSLLTLLAGCTQHRVQLPQAVKGVLDLRQWDFKANGTVKLDGQWEFYWKKLLNPAGISDADLIRTPETAYIRFPSYWDKLTISRERLPSHGYGTYALRVLLPNHFTSAGEELALKFNTAETAYAAYTNGHLVSKNGIVGTDYYSMVPQWNPTVSEVFQAQKEIRLILHVSNFYYRHGGTKNSIEMGLQRQIYRKRIMALVQESFIAGCIFLMGVYHMILFALRRKNTSPLFFAMVCFLIAVRSLLTNEGLLKDLLQNFSWEILTKIEFLGAYLAAGIFIPYMRGLFPTVFSRRAALFLMAVSALISLIIIIFPADIYSRCNDYFQGYVLLAMAYSMYALIRGFGIYRRDMIIFVIGFLFIVLTTINDILIFQNVIKSIYLLHIGLLFFLLAQSFLLSLRFSQAFSEVESLSAAMQSKNLELLTLDRLKDEFLSNVSHEMRTPLTGIQMYSEFLEDGIDDEKMRLESLRQITAGSAQLNKIIERILFLSQIESENVIARTTELEPLDILRECVATHTTLNLSERVSVSGEASGFESDVELFRKFTAEILDNFVKFAGKEAQLVIGIARDHENITLSFTDNGPGVAQVFLNSLGVKFQRADSSLTYVQSGIGVGLYLVKRIVQLLGWTIAFENAPVGGLRIIITIKKGKNA